MVSLLPIRSILPIRCRSTVRLVGVSIGPLTQVSLNRLAGVSIGSPEQVSFDRPSAGLFYKWEVFFVAWAERNGAHI